MKKIIVGILCLFILKLNAQTAPENLSKEEITFFYRVKTIEDFIYRFNDDSMSLMRLDLTDMHKANELNRTKSLRTTFNQENKSFKKDTAVTQFIKYVLTESNNCYLHFTDSNWYCKARCHFQYLGKDFELPIILTIKDYGEKGVKWMILGIEDSYIFKDVQGDSILKSKKLIKKSIGASSYAVNFLDLNRIFNSSLNEKLCFDEKLLETERAKKFINLIKSKDLSFEYAYDLTFYFLQIPNYVFEVDEFSRNTNNSGWLINKVSKMNKKSKKEFLNKLVQRQIAD